MRVPSLCASFVLLAGLFGCSRGDNPYSSSTYAVSGKVIGPDGQPVRNAEILLTPKLKDGKAFGAESSAVTKDGTFALKGPGGEDGVRAGFYAVSVRPHGTPAERAAASKAIPKKYWEETSTDLTVEITAAKADWEIKLAK